MSIASEAPGLEKDLLHLTRVKEKLLVGRAEAADRKSVV